MPGCPCPVKGGCHHFRPHTFQPAVCCTCFAQSMCCNCNFLHYSHCGINYWFLFFIFYFPLQRHMNLGKQTVEKDCSNDKDFIRGFLHSPKIKCSYSRFYYFCNRNLRMCMDVIYFCPCCLSIWNVGAPYNFTRYLVIEEMKRLFHFLPSVFLFLPLSPLAAVERLLQQRLIKHSAFLQFFPKPLVITDYDRGGKTWWQRRMKAPPSANAHNSSSGV